MYRSLFLITLYTQVKGEDGNMRVDACVNAANVLAAWADVEEATGDLAAAAQLLASSVEGYQRSLEQEEDAAVRTLAPLCHLTNSLCVYNPKNQLHRCCNPERFLMKLLEPTMSRQLIVTATHASGLSGCMCDVHACERGRINGGPTCQKCIRRVLICVALYCQYSAHWTSS